MKKLIILLIFGLSMIFSASANEIPAAVQAWLDAELAKAVVKEPIELNSKDFFNATPARLIGYIKDYDAAWGFTTGNIHLGNDITKEQHPVLIPIQPDGRFNVELPMLYPVYKTVFVDKYGVNFYIEPGQTLAIIGDLEEFLKSRTVEFQGPLAQTNRELMLAANFANTLPIAPNYMENSVKMTPNDYKAKNKQQCKSMDEAVKNFVEKEKLTAKTKEILTVNQQVIYGLNLLEYQLAKRINPEDKTEYPADFYDFLQEMPLNNPALLISDNFEAFLNRFENAKPFDNSGNGIVWKTKLIAENYLQQWHNEDSILRNDLHLLPNFAYEIIKVHKLAQAFPNMNPERGMKLLLGVEPTITHPVLKAEAKRMYDKTYLTNEKQAYELPAGKATEIFQRIVNPYKGKILLVDFWATWCAPCIGNIERQKEFRAQHQGSKDIDFVFITDETSPLNRYNKLVEEQKLTNTVRLSVDDYNYLRQLFKFNGIPKYIIVDKDGRILDDNANPQAFEKEINNEQ